MSEHKFDGAWVDELALMPDGTTKPYPLPELPRAEVAELEAATAEQVVTVRDEASQFVANLGNDKLPHFLVTDSTGREVCGSDRLLWPCPSWTDEVAPAAVEASADAAPPAAYTAEEVQAAELLGITAAEVREMVRTR